MVRKCHELDPTRVVTAAVNGNNEKGVSDALDIIGFNYELKFPDDFHQKNPTRPIYGSETASTIATRGIYQTDPLRNTLSAYDVNHTAWSEWPRSGGHSTARASGRQAGLHGLALIIAASPRLMDGLRSTRSSASWICADFPRTTSFITRRGGRKEPMLHLFPHWNWEGREGEEIPVWVFSNLDEVELLVNGKSAGTSKGSAIRARGVEGALRARRDRGARLEGRKACADGKARDDRAGRVARLDRRSHRQLTLTARTLRC